MCSRVSISTQDWKPNDYNNAAAASFLLHNPVSSSTHSIDITYTHTKCMRVSKRHAQHRQRRHEREHSGCTKLRTQHLSGGARRVGPALLNPSKVLLYLLMCIHIPPTEPRCCHAAATRACESHVLTCNTRTTTAILSRSVLPL